MAFRGFIHKTIGLPKSSSPPTDLRSSPSMSSTKSPGLPMSPSETPTTPTCPPPVTAKKATDNCLDSAKTASPSAIALATYQRHERRFGENQTSTSLKTIIFRSRNADMSVTRLTPSFEATMEDYVHEIRMISHGLKYKNDPPRYRPYKPIESKIKLVHSYEERAHSRTSAEKEPTYTVFQKSALYGTPHIQPNSYYDCYPEEYDESVCAGRNHVPSLHPEPQRHDYVVPVEPSPEQGTFFQTIEKVGFELSRGDELVIPKVQRLLKVKTEEGLRVRSSWTVKASDLQVDELRAINRAAAMWELMEMEKSEDFDGRIAETIRLQIYPEPGEIPKFDAASFNVIAFLFCCTGDITSKQMKNIVELQHFYDECPKWGPEVGGNKDLSVLTAIGEEKFEDLPDYDEVNYEEELEKE